MQAAAGVLDVDGNAHFNGGDTHTLLTDGELHVGGNFSTAPYCCWHYHQFVASGGHRVEFLGDFGQEVGLGSTDTGSANSNFQDAVLGADHQVTFVQSAVLLGDLLVEGDMVVLAGKTVDIYGVLTLAAGSSLNNSGTVRYNAYVNNGGTVDGNPPIPLP